VFPAENIVKNLSPEEMADRNEFLDPATGEPMEVVEQMPMIEWLANSYKSFGATLEIITNKSQEGSQFVKGFGGIGGTYSICGVDRTRSSHLWRALVLVCCFVPIATLC
jgi:peptide chain release factor subunit 1